MAREIKPVQEMAQDLMDERDKNGYGKRLYKAASDEHKGDMLANDILQRASLLIEGEARGKVDFNSMDDVEKRTMDYFTACSEAQVYPSVMGLAVHGYGISRQALNQYLLRNPNSPATDFINRAKDVMADILTNASLYNNANAVQAIFQLKNHFEHADKMEIQPVPPEPSGGWSMKREDCVAIIQAAEPGADIAGLSDSELHTKAIMLKYADLPDD